MGNTKYKCKGYSLKTFSISSFFMIIENICVCEWKTNLTNSFHFIMLFNLFQSRLANIWNTVSMCTVCSLQWRHNGRDGVSNHQPHECLLNRSFRRRSKKTSKLRVTGLCQGNSPMTGEIPAQRASDAVNVFIWWRHHGAPVWRSLHFSILVMLFIFI